MGQTAKKLERAGTATRAGGKKTAIRIIDAARSILMSQDYTQFTMRNVAKKADVHLANVQYYYPKREDLLHALFVDTGNRYTQAYQQCIARAPDSPLGRFKAVIDYSLQDIVVPDTRRFFLQLWALLGSMDNYSGRLLGELYAIDIAQLSDRIQEMYPKMAGKELEHRATLLAAMIEGLMVVIGDGNPRSRRTNVLLSKAQDMALQIAQPTEKTLGSGL